MDDFAELLTKLSKINNKHEMLFVLVQVEKYLDRVRKDIYTTGPLDRHEPTINNFVKQLLTFEDVEGALDTCIYSLRNDGVCLEDYRVAPKLRAWNLFWMKYTGMTEAELLKGIKGHILGFIEDVGSYERRGFFEIFYILNHYHNLTLENDYLTTLLEEHFSPETMGVFNTVFNTWGMDGDSAVKWFVVSSNYHKLPLHTPGAIALDKTFCNREYPCQTRTLGLNDNHDLFSHICYLLVKKRHPLYFNNMHHELKDHGIVLKPHLHENLNMMEERLKSIATPAEMVRYNALMEDIKAYYPKA